MGLRSVAAGPFLDRLTVMMTAFNSIVTDISTTSRIVNHRRLQREATNHISVV